MNIIEYTLKIFTKDCEDRKCSIELFYSGDGYVRISYEDYLHSSMNCAIRVPKNVIEKFMELIK